MYAQILLIIGLLHATYAGEVFLPLLNHVKIPQHDNTKQRSEKGRALLIRNGTNPHYPQGVFLLYLWGRVKSVIPCQRNKTRTIFWNRIDFYHP